MRTEVSPEKGNQILPFELVNLYHRRSNGVNLNREILLGAGSCSTWINNFLTAETWHAGPGPFFYFDAGVKVAYTAES